MGKPPPCDCEHNLFSENMFKVSIKYNGQWATKRRLSFSLGERNVTFVKISHFPNMGFTVLVETQL